MWRKTDLIRQRLRSLTHSQMAMSMPSLKRYILNINLSQVKLSKYESEFLIDKHEKISKDSFHLLNKLGKGSFGLVYLAQKKNTGKMYALKCLDKHHIISKDKVKSVHRERNIL